MVTNWDRALAAWQKAEAALDAASHEPDQDHYDALLNAATAALRHVLRMPVLDLRAFSAKLDLIVAHQAWELTGGEACLVALQADARRLAGA